MYVHLYLHQPSCGDIGIQYIYIVGTFLFFFIFFSSRAQSTKTQNKQLSLS